MSGDMRGGAWDPAGYRRRRYGAWGFALFWTAWLAGSLTYWVMTRLTVTLVGVVLLAALAGVSWFVVVPAETRRRQMVARGPQLW